MSSTNHPENVNIGDHVWVKQGKTDHVAIFLGPENDNDKALVKWASTGLNDNVSFASIRPMGRAMARRSQRHKRSNKVKSATQNKESKSTTDTSNLEATTSRNDYIFPNGTKVIKHWDGHPYNGTVVQYDPEEKWYQIHFEDNDVEDWTQEELLQHIDKDALTQAELRGKTTPKKTTRRACNDAAAVVLSSEDDSGSNDDDDSDAWSMAEEESNDDITDDEEMLAIATTPHKQTTKKAKQSSSILATTVTPSPSTQKTRGKQHSPRKKSSPPSRRKLHRSQPSSLPSSATRRTIANFGLPRGALAKCPHTGVTIRSVDGILPLVKKDSWQHATSSATTTTSSSNDTNCSLPGKILVVSADDAGTLLVPPEDFVGRTFASVKDICDRAKNYSACSSAIHYDMEVVADPVFAPWEFLQDRLISSGLLPQEDDDDSNKNKDHSPMLFVVTIDWDQNGRNQVMGEVTWYQEYIQKKSQPDVDDDSALLWTILETSQREITPSVLLGVPQTLLKHSMFAMAKKSSKMIDDNDDDENDDVNDEAGSGNKDESSHKNLLPLPISDAAKIRLSASLLQKSIRRGTSLCSSAPVAEACRALLYGDINAEDTSQQIKTRKSPPPGSTLAMLKTLWECMMVDASPFDNGHDCLGLPSLLLLSLVAKADSAWTLPEPLRKMTVASALRTSQSTPSVPWVGFADRNNKWWMLEDCDNTKDSPTHQKATNLRNILRAAQSIVGGRLLWGKWSSFIGDASAAAVMSYLNHEDWEGSQLPAPPPSRPEDHEILVALENGKEPIKSTDPRINHLDRECQLAAIEPSVIPSALVLLQASLSCPPTKWRKHSLPALSKQVRKLISEANARHQEQAQLVRLATWGNDKAESRAPIPSATKNKVSKSKPQQLPPAFYQSFREVVTPTSILSQQENELVDCFEAIQEWVVNRLAKRSDSKIAKAIPLPDTPVKSAKFGEEITTNFRQMKSGPPLTNVDGRIGFLLAFAFSIEVVVKTPFSEEKEVVSAMFCGDANEPLLVQRIGKARREGKEAATVGGTTSGATAVPSLGYVQRDRCKEERFLFEAAEKAAASHWKDGKVFPLPLPPAGCQWELSQGTEDLAWEAKEAAVERTATLQHKNGKKQWHFTIDGKEINAFDARPVMSPCMLDVEEPDVLQPGTDHDRLLRTALYVKSENENLSYGKAVLEALEKLHLLAEGERETTFGGLSEGRVFNWIPLAQKSPIPARTWRDAILAIRTRDKCHVVLGKGIRSDGGGTPLDLSEGVLVRVFHVLEFLYPQAIRKESALKFRVRPRGAAYYHLLVSLEMLGRGEVTNEALGNCHSKRASTKVDQKRKHRDDLKPNKNNERDNRTVLDATDEGKRGYSQSIKRPRRCAAFFASKRITRMSTNEEQTNTISQRRSFLSQEKKRVKRRQIVRSRNNVRKRVRKKKGDSDNESWGDNDEDVLSDDDNLDFDVDDEGSNSDKSDGEEKQEFLPLPKIKTKLWPHQEKSVSNIVEGVMNGKRGHADASAVGAGKTLTALATIARLARWVEGSQKSRHGVLVMLPTKALIKEWLIEIATHTEGFHLIEQREDGTLFSLTYGKSHPPIDGNSLVISTLDRVCNHPFIRQAAWDFVVIDECLSVQNAGAKRTPSAWRQIEVSLCGVLMLSATFFRSKYDQLFYMIRMLRSPLPRTIEWLPATIHEHIVCQIPETDRSWKMVGEMVPLDANDLREYRNKIDKFRRKQINEPNVADGRKLWVDLECFLRLKYEGRTTTKTYAQTSPMGVAFVKAAKGLLRKGRKPLIFADTSQEGDFLIRVLRKQGLNACTWSEVRSRKGPTTSKTVIVAVKTVEGQGINMQGHADAIICRPTPGDHLEQMKGRIDRPGQKEKDLVLIVVVAEHTIEEAKFANIRLAGNFFREYIAPVATKYKERIDLEATLAAGGTKKLKSGTVSGTWKKSLETEGQSGAFADIVESSSSIPGSLNTNLDTDTIEENATHIDKKSTGGKDEPKYKPLNKVLRNKGDPRAIRQAKSQAKDGKASQAVRSWLFPRKGTRKVRQKGLAKDSLKRFSDTVPPLILDPSTIYEAVAHLSKEDSKLAALIARIGPDVLIRDCGIPQLPTQARLFDKCVRAITFTMVSVDAGTSFLRRLAMKIGVCLMAKGPSTCKKLLKKFLKSIKEAGGYENLKGHEDLLQCLLNGQDRQFLFTHDMMRELVDDCEIIGGKRSGYPHICGVTFPCGKNDDHSIFREKARAQASGESRETVSAGYSRGKASFLVSLVEDFENGTISGEKIANASDREAAKMLIGLKGIGDWSAAQVLMSFLSRADVMLYGDLTVRNYLNELYDINHQNESETLLESAADFGDTGENRNLIDDLAKKNKWGPYRSVVCYLMYYLQQENLVLL